VVQRNNSEFLGFFLLNSNAQEFRVYRPTSTRVEISVVAIGGIIDLFVFTGPTFQKVI
jgi:hypothetical protein